MTQRSEVMRGCCHWVLGIRQKAEVVMSGFLTDVRGKGLEGKHKKARGERAFRRNGKYTL